MDKIYNYDQYLGMSLDFSVIVNSTLDLKPGSILCIDNEDIEKLDYLINEALNKDVDKILTSSKSKISDDKVYRFEDYEKVFEDILKNINPDFKNKIFFGITGTNGKSSLAYYLEQLLNKASSAIALGNYGNALLDNLEHTKKYSVIEVSSFQLDKMKENNFDLTVITNIQRDHIDYHGSFEAYRECKLKICRDGIKNLISDDETDLSDLAFQVFEYLEPKANLDSFELKDLPHRLEEFRTWFINDYKSTNLASLEYDLKQKWQTEHIQELEEKMEDLMFWCKQMDEEIKRKRNK